LTERFQFIDDYVPFSSADGDNIPFIGLPCRIHEPTIERAQLKATADAAHEAFHVIAASYRPFRDVNSTPWHWFNEGTAVFAERLLLQGNDDNLRFAVDWSDRPEEPLDSESSWYQAGIFVHYLANLLGTDFLSKVWTESLPTETPLTAIVRLLPKGVEFASADVAIDDLFASGYAIDSYCSWGQAATNFCHDVFGRYGTRAITEVFEIRLRDEVRQRERDTLNHLAVRYYRFSLGSGCRSLRVRLNGLQPDETNRLKATLLAVNSGFVRGGSVRLQRVAEGCLEGTLTVDSEPDLDHVVLVVANCGTRSSVNSPHSPHDDSQAYSIEADAN
jgi:hypothetical protein